MTEEEKRTLRELLENAMKETDMLKRGAESSLTSLVSEGAKMDEATLHIVQEAMRTSWAKEQRLEVLRRLHDHFFKPQTRPRRNRPEPKKDN